jgi:hypothetical protein
LGWNDYGVMLVGGKSVADVQSYVPQVVGTISAAIEVNFWYYILQEKESDQIRPNN